MATGPRLVNKQFNTPIGLYSQQNIQETLNKQSQVLNNGAVGIDFNNPMNSKPANLANSAVLRMLEEEEQRQRSGQPGSLKRVAWPPPSEETNGEEAEHEIPVQRQAAPVKLHQSPALSRLIPFEQNPEPVSHSAPQAQVYSPQPKLSQSHSPQPKFSQPLSPQPKFSQPLSPQPKFSQPLSPQSSLGKPVSPQPTTPTQTFPPPVPQFNTFPRKAPSTFAPVSNKSYAPVSQVAPQPFGVQPFEPKTFAPVSSHVYAPIPPSAFSPISSLTQRECELLSPQPYSPVHSLGSSPLTRAEQQGAWAPSIQGVAPQQNQFTEPPPATITLRPTAPVHQKPAPVVASQPVARSFRGGANMRGDQKWPPQSVKEAVAAENEARITLAKGPACRPRKVKKDYTKFFAKNALPNNYPGYKIPPGTQHYDEQSGASQY